MVQDSAAAKRIVRDMEWVEDRFFARHGHYAPSSDATPENQAEHPAENTLLTDHDEAISRMCYEMGIREDDDDAFELAGINPTRHQPTDY